MKKAEQERLHTGPWCEDLLAALDTLPRDVSTACALINLGMVTDLDALPSRDDGKAMAEQEEWSGVVSAYQATVTQRLASRNIPLDRQCWIDPDYQPADYLQI